MSIGEANPWNEEQRFRRDAINGSRKLREAIQKLQERRLAA